MAGGDHCEACGERTPFGARYCPECGCRLDSPVVDITAAESAADDRTTVSPLRRVGVLAAVGALLGILGVVLLAGGDSETDQAAESRNALTPLPLPTPDLTPTPTPPPTLTLTPTSSPEVTPTSAPAPLPAVSTDWLPEIGATHLVAVGRTQVHFFEMATGEWGSHDLPSRSQWVDRVIPIADAVAIAVDDGVWIAHPERGVTSLDTARDAWLVGVGGDNAIVQQFGPGVGAGALVAFDLDGVEQWRLELPERTWPQGTTSQGEVIVQMGSRIAAISPGSSRVVATGIANGTLRGRWVVAWDCTSIDSCATELVNTEDGSRLAIEASNPWVYGELVATDALDGDGIIRTTFYVVHDGAILEIPDPNLTMRQSAVAVDDAGYLLWGSTESVVLEAIDGGRWSLETPDGNPRAVGFLTIDP